MERKKRTTVKIRFGAFMICLLIGACGNAQHKTRQPVTLDKNNAKLLEMGYILRNSPALEELFEIRGLVKSVETTVTELQSVEAVNSPDKKEVYVIQLSVNARQKTITEISDQYKSGGFRIQNVYTYDADQRIISQSIYEDDLDGKGWQLKERKEHSYSKDKDGNFYTEAITSSDPRPGEEARQVPGNVHAFYNDKKQLVKKVERGVTFEYAYNEQGDVSMQKIDGGSEDSRGILMYKYEYDANSNWIKKEEYETTAYKDNLLQSIMIRRIVY